MAQDAVALIKADHRKVEQLFREFEEETYYPAVEAKAKRTARS